MSRRTQKNVGVIGLGIIGRRVADNLRRRGFHVFVWNRTPRPVPNFVGSPAELAELCDFVQIFVSDDEALMQMVQEMKPALHVQHVIMAHSTVAPHTMRNAAEIVKRRGAEFLDAPFTGSKIPAEKGELVYYVAGDEAAYRRARPVLEASSKEIIEIGEIGQATTVKIATNMVTAATVQAASEAMALVHHSGLAPEKLTAALRGNASNSGTLSMKLPKMIEGDFDPHFSVKHMLKDVQIAARMARSYGLTLGATEAARDSLLDESQSGRGDQDFSSLVRFFFPDGLPSEVSAKDDADAAQPTLGDVDEEAAAAQLRASERPAPPEPDAAPTGPEGKEAPELTAADIEDADKAPAADDEQREDRPAAAAAAGRTDDSPPSEDTPGPTVVGATADDDDDERSERAARPPEDRDSTPSGESAHTNEAAPAADDSTPDPQAADEEPDVTADARDVTEEQADAAEEVQATTGAGEEPPDAGEQEPAPERAAVASEVTDVEDSERTWEREHQVSEPTSEREQPAIPAEELEPVSERELPAPDESDEERVPEPERVAEPVAVAAASAETRTRDAGDYEFGGEPPRERRPNGDREAQPTEPPPERDDTAARRSFLSRMFGKGDDY